MRTYAVHAGEMGWCVRVCVCVCVNGGESVTFLIGRFFEYQLI